MKNIFLLSICLLSFGVFAEAKAVGKNVDILFVIDNSGSMTQIQQNLINNTKTFFEQFARQPYINWKVGIVSTDKADRPYLGFDSTFDWSLFDYRDPTSIDQAVNQFQSAVMNLGNNGDGSEYIFYNIKRNLDFYNGQTRPRFLRPNADLVVVMISDEEEQSLMEFGASYDAPNFLQIMLPYKDASKTLRFYGALSSKDLKGCEKLNTMQHAYAGSQFEAIINLTKGFNVSACASDFGIELAKIGKDIANLSK